MTTPAFKANLLSKFSKRTLDFDRMLLRNRFLKTRTKWLVGRRHGFGRESVRQLSEGTAYSPSDRDFEDECPIYDKGM
jgi:hypothetical protein